MFNSKHLDSIEKIKSNLPSSIVVFLVALPLCLGIALASGAPLFSGIISGIIGGIVVGALSGSTLGVSGPAAGLAMIVLNAITDIGSFEGFLVAVVLAGVIQLIMGYARAGIIGYYFPSSVIHGMLTGIGILLILKQLPHAFGYDVDQGGDQRFIQSDGHNTFSELYYTLNHINLGAVVITIISLLILILWDSRTIKKHAWLRLFPGPLVAVGVGILLKNAFESIAILTISMDHLVSLPISDNISDFISHFRFPDFRQLDNTKIYITAIMIAVVASLETLLSLEATDKLDPIKRISPANRELKAQGIGNIISGLIGGIPITQVIVRSSTNIHSGGNSKLSTILHGVWLFASILFIPRLLNQIPLATLAAVLLIVGYKLVHPGLFKRIYRQGWEQFIPFISTIIAMLLSDLLKGILIGMGVAVFIILKNNLKVPFHIKKETDGHLIMILSEDVSFLNKAAIQKSLSLLPDKSIIEIDGTRTHFMHHDIFEIIDDFEISAVTREIKVSKIGFSHINNKNTHTVHPHTYL